MVSRFTPDRYKGLPTLELERVELIGGRGVSSGKGVDHVLRWLWCPAHRGRAILRQMRQADCPERSRVVSWSAARWRACCGSGCFEWSRAAQSPPSGDSLDDQRHSPAGGNRLDDDFRQDVFPVYAELGKPGRVAHWGQMGLGRSFHARPLFRGHFSGALRCAALGSGLGTIRARAVGAVPRASPGIPGAAAISAGDGALGIYTLWVLLPETSGKEYELLAQPGGQVNSATVSS